MFLSCNMILEAEILMVVFDSLDAILWGTTTPPPLPTNCSESVPNPTYSYKGLIP